ncbi:MAG: hypothetical protein ACUVTD_08600 [Nitrososphaerales archaeon]
MRKRVEAFVLVVLFCSFFLISSANAAGGVTQAAKGGGFILEIYGNANEDDTIDARDITYTKLIIFGKKPETGLADAKYDGSINVLDVIQVKLIILGKEAKLTLIDSANRTITIPARPKTIILNSNIAEIFAAIGADIDLVTGVGEIIPEYWKLPKELKEKRNVGS